MVSPGSVANQYPKMAAPEMAHMWAAQKALREQLREQKKLNNWR